MYVGWLLNRIVFLLDLHVAISSLLDATIGDLQKVMDRVALIRVHTCTCMTQHMWLVDADVPPDMVTS